MEKYWNIFIKEVTDGDPYFLQIKGVDIRWYSVLILLGAIISIIMLRIEAKRTGVDKEFIFNLAFWTIIFGFIGARLYYVLFEFSKFSGDLMSIFKIWEGGLAIHGGIIAGGITIFVYCKKYHVEFFRATDMALPCLILAQCIGRWGNFFNREAHGTMVSLQYLQDMHLPKFIIDGMKIGSAYYEPTFLYESIACLIGFILLMVIRHLKYTKVGTVTAVYLMYYGVVRFFIENMRTDPLLLGKIKMAQVTSIIMFVFGLLMLMLISRKGRFEDLYNEMKEERIGF